MNDVELASKNARAALSQQLKNIAPLAAVIPDTRWSMPNRTYNPVDKTLPWLRIRVRSSGSQLISVGSEKRRTRHFGVFFVDLFLKTGQGTNQGDTLMGLLQKAFEPGTILQYGGQVVQIRQWLPDGEDSDELWYQRNFAVSFTTDTVSA